MIAKELQSGDAEHGLNKGYRWEERPKWLPLMPEQKVNRRLAAAFDADPVAGLAHHRRREHNAAGRGQHPHHQRNERQSEPAALEQALHGRDEPAGQADLFHRRSNDVDQQHQRSQ